MSKRILALLMALTMVISMAAFPVSATEAEDHAHSHSHEEVVVDEAEAEVDQAEAEEVVEIVDEVVAQPDAADGHTHCLCGGAPTGAASHTCDANVTWTAWSESDVAKAGASTASTDNWSPAAGTYYWYLDDNVTLTGSRAINLNSGVHINICLNGHTLTVAGTAGDGGRIFINNGGSLTITDCSYDPADGSFDGTFTLNETVGTKDGGLIYVYGGTAVANIYGGNFTDGNAATDSGTGGLFNVKGTLNIYNGNIYGGRSNTGSKDGGNIALTASTSIVNIYGGTISGGKARHGGNIYAGTSGAKLNFYGGTIKDGEATGSGGNIYIGVIGSVALKGTIQDGKAGSSGGNLYLQMSTTIDGTTFIGGTAGTTGGSVHNAGTTATMKNVTITGGTAGTNGGALYFTTNASGNKTLTNCTISGGQAVMGGNVYMESQKTVTITGGSISNGTALGTDADDNNDGMGGNLYVCSAATISGTSFSGGEAQDRGGSIASNGGKLTMSNVTVDGGHATSSGGGVFLWLAGAAGSTLTNCTLMNGTCDGNGGNLCVNPSATTTITGGSITDGNALRGGNVATFASCTIDGTAISDGTVKTGGNGSQIVSYDGGSLTLKGETTVSGTDTGWGISLNDPGEHTASHVISGGTYNVYVALGNVDVAVTGSPVIKGFRFATAADTAVDLTGYEPTEGHKIALSISEESLPLTFATVSEDLSDVFTMSNGHVTYSETSLIAEAHDFADATCDTPATCSCGATEGDPVHGNIIHVEAKAATCTELGNIEYWYCETCGQAWLDAEYTQNTNLKAVVLPKAEHTASEAVKENVVAASCETDGSYEEVVYCSVCNEEISRETKVITAYHNGNMEYHPAKDAIDCQNPGNIENWQCPGCGEYFADAYAEEIINPWFINITADHVRPEGAADCATVPCEVCGEELIGAGEHTVLICQGGTCEKCGQVVEGVGCANYTTPACEDGVCYYCGGFVAGLGHENGAWAPCQEGECTYGCGLKYEATAEHVDEDEDDYCDTCWSHLNHDVDPCVGGECSICWTYIEGAHTPAEAVKENVVDAVECVSDGSYDLVVYCSVCNEELSRESFVVSAHTYENNCSQFCSVCDEWRMNVPHGEIEHVEAKIPANCQEEGWDEYWTCKDCGACFEDAEATIQTNPAWLKYTGSHIRPEGSADCAIVTCELCGLDSYGTAVCVLPEGTPACEGGTCVNCGDVVYAVAHSYGVDENGESVSPLCEAGDCIYCGQHFDYIYEHENGTYASCANDGECIYGCGKVYPADGMHELDDPCAGGMCWKCYQEVEPMHNVVHVEAVAPTCYENGNIEYWYCEDCGQAWLDAEYTQNTNLKAVVLPMAEHSYVHGVCSVCGAVDGEFIPVASANGVNYESLAEAIAAAEEGSTVTLLADATGAGAVIDKDITIDFGGFTYTLNEGVGSGSLTSNGFQLLKGNNVTLKNGTLEVAEADASEFYILVQNYANLTVEDMILDGTNLDKWSKVEDNWDSYTLSINSGNVSIAGDTKIIANNDGENAYAFDVCKYANYVAPVVTVENTVVIEGNVEAVAKVGNVYYATLAEAVAAAEAGSTVTLLADATGAGAVIDKDITIDFGGFTYTLNEGVGSGSLTSNGFQLLKGNNVTLKNGTLEVAEADASEFYILVQNYANLTVEDMTLDGTNLDKWSKVENNWDSYTLSINSGNVSIAGDTNIIANNDGENAYAFDVCKYSSYELPTVNVNTTGTIAGDIVVDGGNLELDAATIEGELVYNSGNAQKADTVDVAAPEGYHWADGVLGAHEYYYACDPVCMICYEITNPEATHTIVAVEAVAATCYENGNVAYWYCSDCGSVWTDAELTQVSNMMSIVVPMGHGTITHVEAVAPTYNAIGNIEYWYCEACGQAWLDEACTLNTNLKAVVLPMLEGVASVDGVNYGTLEEAIAVGGEVKLLSDVEITTSIKITNTVTIDLNGQKVTGPDDGVSNWYAFIVDGGNLTLKDSVGGGELYAKCYGVETKSGSFTMESGKITATRNGTVGTPVVNYGGTVTINGGELAGAFAAVSTGGHFAVAETVIKGGELTGPVEISEYNAKGCTVKSTDNTLDTYEGYEWVEQDGVYVLTAINYVASANGVKYESLAEAVAAAEEGSTVTLLGDATGAGVVIDKDITIDLGGYTYTFNQTVGSAGTTTLGFQILKNNDVVIKNGTLTSTATVEGSKEVKVLVMNYANLTLEDVNLVDNTEHILYALSVNSGDVNLTGSTSITTDAVAFDTCKFASYELPTVNVNTTGTIAGDIVVDGGNLELDAATIEGELVYNSGNAQKADTVDVAAPEGYHWADGVLGAHEYFYACDPVCMICYEITNPEATHTIVAVEAVAATCYENGNVAYWYCSDCGAVWTDAELTQISNMMSIVVPMGHGTITHVEAVAPTCYENGNIEYWYCEDCGQAWLDEACTQNTNLKAVVLPMADHTEAEAVVENEVAATCTAKGSYDSVVYCSVCNEELSRESIETDMIAHTEGEAVVENEVASTCTIRGTYDSVIYCSVCNEELFRQTIEVELADHTAGEAVVEGMSEAQCDQDGAYMNVVYCSVCNEELSRETVVIPAPGHNYVNGTCSVCGQADPNASYRARVATWTLGLEAEVIMKYFVVIPDEVINDDNAYAQMTIANNTSRIPMSEIRETYDSTRGRYTVQLGVPSSYMTKQVEMSIFDGNGNVVTLYTNSGFEGTVYSKSAGDFIVSKVSKTDQDEIDMAIALATYGGYAQKYFISKDSNVDADPVYNVMADYGYDPLSIDGITNETVNRTYGHGDNEAGVGFTLKSGVVNLDSAVSLRLYFAMDEGYGVDDFTYELTYLDFAGASHTMQMTGALDARGRCELVIEEIPAAYWDYDYKIEVTNNTTGETNVFTASVLAFVTAKLKSSTASDAEKDLARAMYLYNQQASKYFNK